MKELEYAIVFSWALLGAYAALQRGYCDWRVLVAAFCPALAGGTLRNLVLGLGAPAWVTDQGLLVAMGLGCVSGVFLFSLLGKLLPWVRLLDLGVILFVTLLYTHRAATGYWTVLDPLSSEWLPKHFDLIPSLFAGIVTSLGGGILGEVILKASLSLFEKDGPFGPDKIPVLEPCLLAALNVWLTVQQPPWLSLSCGGLTAAILLGLCAYFRISNARLYGSLLLSRRQSGTPSRVNSVVPHQVS